MVHADAKMTGWATPWVVAPRIRISARADGDPGLRAGRDNRCVGAGAGVGGSRGGCGVGPLGACACVLAGAAVPPCAGSVGEGARGGRRPFGKVVLARAVGWVLWSVSGGCVVLGGVVSCWVREPRARVRATTLGWRILPYWAPHYKSLV